MADDPDEGPKKARDMKFLRARGQPVYAFGLYLALVCHENKDEPEQNRFDVNSNPGIYGRQK